MSLYLYIIIIILIILHKIGNVAFGDFLTLSIIQLFSSTCASDAALLTKWYKEIIHSRKTIHFILKK